MKTTKQNLNAIALGVAMAMGTLSAPASAATVGPGLEGLPPLPLHPVGAAAAAFFLAEINPIVKDPTFEASERTGLALVESALSLIAAREHIDPVTCSEKVYKLKVDAFDLEGSAIIKGDGEKAQLDASLTEVSLGAQVDVSATPGSSLYGAEIKNYVGDHQWSRKNNIFLDHATWDFKHPQSGRVIPYDEHSIKDYFKYVTIDGAIPTAPELIETPLNESWEFDAGFEVITKKNKPVTKWGELSWYRQQDGASGVLVVTKQLIAKGLGCNITYAATGFAPFDFAGKVYVTKGLLPVPVGAASGE